jgi:DNA-binding MarR family transcriptional regulator
VGGRISVIARSRRLLLIGRNEARHVPGKAGLILCTLLHEDGCGQDELATRLFLDKATVARGLLGLERQGYVVRKGDQGDRRRKLVFVTDKARATAQALEQIALNLDRELLRGLSPQEADQLAALLERIEANARLLAGRNA